DPYKKFAAQIMAALIIAYLAELRTTSLSGLFGIYDIPVPASYALTMLFFVITLNAFNRIDGIVALAAANGTLVCATSGSVFFQMGNMGFALVAFTLVGALLGFMRFNISRARIFMGDSGSYTTGFVIAILTVLFVELNKFDLNTNPYPFVRSVPAV